MEIRPEVPASGAGRAPDGAGPVLPAGWPAVGPPGTGLPGPAARRRRRPRRSLAMKAMLALALAGLTAAVAGIVVQMLPRIFSPAQQQQISAWEVGKRWRTWPAGTIFPASVHYLLSVQASTGSWTLPLQARRVGIAREAACGSATDGTLVRTLAAHGCLTVLRATYDDGTGSMAVTVGIAVMPDAAAAQAVARSIPGAGKQVTGLRVVAYRRTLAARFSNRARQLTADARTGPYLLLAVAGYADGRPWVNLPRRDRYADAEMSSLANGVVQAIATNLGKPPPPPHCPGTPGC